MKIFPFLLLALALLTSDLHAQFTVGLKSGFTRAWEDYGDIGLPENAVIHVNGFHLSGLFYYQIGKRFQVGLEPGFVKRGAACEPGFSTFEGDSKLLLSYLELPLMLSYRQPLTQNGFSVLSKIGFGAAQITTAYQEVVDLRGDTPPVRTRITDDIRLINRLDYGFYGSLGLAYPVGRSQVFLSADYYYGLRDVDSWFDSQNRSLNLSIGWIKSLSPI